ncbi:hypothetical protein FOCC_FOCC008725 [Frankliniella occidentalis]|nr:hypothetical protein FOCC_FOCC008725 [Frankliniella occidentalis]
MQLLAFITFTLALLALALSSPMPVKKIDLGLGFRPMIGRDPLAPVAKPFKKKGAPGIGTALGQAHRIGGK